MNKNPMKYHKLTANDLFTVLKWSVNLAHSTIMPTIDDTACPRLRASIPRVELDYFYTPTQDEIDLSKVATRLPSSQLGFLILLKTFQRLGYFTIVAKVPNQVTKHIMKSSGLAHVELNDLVSYGQSSSRWKHQDLILSYLKVNPYSKEGEAIVIEVMRKAVQTKDDLVDLINVSVEELIRKSIELPGFSILLKKAKKIRSEWNENFFHKVNHGLTPSQKSYIDKLFFKKDATSDWDLLKQDTGNPTLENLRTHLGKLKKLDGLSITSELLKEIPNTKIERIAAEAKTFDIWRMRRFSPEKRYSLALCLFVNSRSQVLDDFGQMLVKKLRRFHADAYADLDEWRIRHQSKAEELIGKLDTIAGSCSKTTSDRRKLREIEKALGNPDQVKRDCEAYTAYSNNNYLPFILPRFSSSRNVLFQILDEIQLIPTTDDQGLMSALKFIQLYRHCKDERVPTCTIHSGQVKKLVKLDWVSNQWWRVITGQPFHERSSTGVNRRHFEVCVFSQIADDLMSGDLAIVGSKEYSDFRDELITPEEYKKELKGFSEQVGLPLDNAKLFVKHLKEQLHETASRIDREFPENKWVSIKNGEPVIATGPRKGINRRLKILEAALTEKLQLTGILDVLMATEYWLGWTKNFQPISGQDTRLENPVPRYLATAFCFGCNLGPSQTARSLKFVNRKEISFIHHKHVTGKRLDRAITQVINCFNRFVLPKYWGPAKSASVDGTKWDLRDRNLLSEYHIRYGGYGGIGYYHVADNYIALFSRFIPCGVYEAVYLLDGPMANESDIKPDTIHGDTHAQNAAVFGLTYLLGIKLMPRIRNWKKLKLYKANSHYNYPHIDSLFTSESIDWGLIEFHLPELVRVAISIRNGKLIPSTILRRLTVRSKKNRLCLAFRELGYVIRSLFLLENIGSRELRTKIHAATTRSERFNDFLQWIVFGGDGEIKSNDRDEQRKIIKYSHLLANLVILYNVQALSKVIRDLNDQGFQIDEELLSHTSPYFRSHINRFGEYRLDARMKVEPLDFEAERDLISNFKPKHKGSSESVFLH